ncbi:MAG: VOC family protein [Porphyromonadaceae bacterium]|nr:VOC family protein [Porphyromonadaceae bacterium]
MKLKNIMIAVKDLEKSKTFYKELFGLDVLLEQEGNVILTEGLVLQDVRIWKGTIKKEVIARNHAAELYFEEKEFEKFMNKLRDYNEPIEYVTNYMEYPWGQKVVRFYDLDGNLIEVRTPMR